MSHTLHEELFAAVMQKLTPLQQGAVIKFANRLAKQRTSKPPAIAESSTAKITPKNAKNTKKQYPKKVEALDGRTPLATQLAHQPPSPIKWEPARRLSPKEMLSSGKRHFDDGTGVRVFQGGLCNRK
jgi:hypothetical protein